MDKVLSLIGLAKRAGFAVIGVPAVCDALRDGRQCTVYRAADVSDATAKRINDKCAFYGTNVVCLTATTAELGHAVGKTSPVGAVAVTDRGLCDAIAKETASDAHNSEEKR